MDSKIEYYQFKDAEDYIERYIKFVDAYTQKGIEAINSLQTTIDTLNERFESVIMAAQNPAPPPDCYFEPIKNPETMSPKVNFFAKKIAKYNSRLASFIEHFNSKAANILSQVIVKLSNCQSDNIAVKYRVKKFFEAIDIEKIDCPYYTKLHKKTLNLIAVTNKLRNKPRYPEIKVEALRASMIENAKRVEPTTEYGPESTFDDSLFYYVALNDGFSQFDEIIQEVSEKMTARTINCSKVESIVAKFAELLRPKHVTHTFVIRNAVSRIFFDRFYIRNSQLYVKQENLHDFLEKCNAVKWSTPKTMDVNDKLLMPTMMNTPFVLLHDKSEELKTSGDDCYMIQYYVNPMDILSFVFKALKCGEDFVRSNSLERRLGRFVSMFEDKKKLASAANAMAFDDFFPLFCLVFSFNPPINAVPVSEFLAHITGIKFPSPFDFAKLFLTSAVEYISNVKASEMVGHDEGLDAEDPLGLSNMKVM